MSFQPYAFQNYAFQTVESGGIPAPIPEHNSGGYFYDRPYKGSHREQLENAKKAVNNLPHKLQQSIKRISKQDILKDEREAALLAEIQHIDSAFQLVYLGYLEQLHADWVEREIARLMLERKMALALRQNEEALVLLMLGVI